MTSCRTRRASNMVRIARMSRGDHRPLQARSSMRTRAHLLARLCRPSRPRANSHPSAHIHRVGLSVLLAAQTGKVTVEYAETSRIQVENCYTTRAIPWAPCSRTKCWRRLAMGTDSSGTSSAPLPQRQISSAGTRIRTPVNTPSNSSSNSNNNFIMHTCHQDRAAP